MHVIDILPLALFKENIQGCYEWWHDFYAWTWRTSGNLCMLLENATYIPYPASSDVCCNLQEKKMCKSLLWSLCMKVLLLFLFLLGFFSLSICDIQIWNCIKFIDLLLVEAKDDKAQSILIGTISLDRWGCVNMCRLTCSAAHG